ncbi:MAG: hypothetical protein EI684_12960 [Candidatus Viridilinea halotolerans]|uniref:Periplasmic heavy metal sensor n=1 Tax=Candidatus Viridilinea halotolerans TaxID=2491704 RepID=A0A426TXV4_9CHLR|nr:MAG: hypothetical protein EI684_12960 [Candidatus Viridilinea halotolerans]
MKRIVTIITAMVAGALMTILALNFALPTQAQTSATDCPPASHGDMAGRGEGRGGTHSLVAKVAEKLSVTREELIAQLGTEGTLAGALEQGGVNVPSFVDDVVAEHTARIEAAVAAGRLTREQADERLASMRERIETQLNTPFAAHEPNGGERGERPERPGRGPRP